MAWLEGWHEPTSIAGIVSAALIAIGGAWRILLKGRRDLRADREGVVVSDSYGAIIGRMQDREVAQAKEIMALRESYARDFAELRADLMDLRNRLMSAHDERDEALTRARAAEVRAASADNEVCRLRERVVLLEGQVRALQQGGAK